MRIEKYKLETEIAAQARSYKHVATAAGITERTLSRARNGREIRPETAGRIASALGVNITDLVKE